MILSLFYISDCVVGAEPPHELIRSAEAGTSEV
jgi:hypothetical protein